MMVNHDDEQRTRELPRLHCTERSVTLAATPQVDVALTPEQRCALASDFA
jgi:hypothetical protein